MQDRRRYARTAVNWSAEVKSAGHPIVPGRIKDISARGTYVEVAIEIPLGQKILVKMQAKFGDKLRPMLIEGAVMRRTVLSQMRGYGYGVVLTRIRNEDKSFFASLEEPTDVPPAPAATGDPSPEEALVEMVNSSVEAAANPATDSPPAADA
jgi:hypothetical protein